MPQMSQSLVASQAANMFYAHFPSIAAVFYRLKGSHSS
jgi:hypothetical protein